MQIVHYLGIMSGVRHKKQAGQCHWSEGGREAIGRYIREPWGQTLQGFVGLPDLFSESPLMIWGEA